jgi:dTDP-4-amino-4,6-dideoxygalactose transaminase
VLSFHATKVFNTFEGGAIICHDERTYQRINYLKNFGFAGETTVVAPGINAKMNEFQAGMGLLQLQYMDEILAKRKAIADRYTARLSGLDGISFLTPGPGWITTTPISPFLWMPPPSAGPEMTCTRTSNHTTTCAAATFTR